jgi:hypothetical protein
MSEIIEVYCLALPSGKNLWFEKSKGEEYLKEVLDKWKKENPEYVNGIYTSGAIIIKMPKDSYIAIGAHYGGGAFVFP